MDDEMDDIVEEFLVESRENLDQLDRDLVALESAPTSRDLLNSIFRTLHTIKGTSGFLAFGKLERLTHVGEGLLVDLRDGARRLDGPTTDVLLALADRVRDVLAAIETTGGDAGVDVAPLIARLEQLRGGGAAAATAAAVPAGAAGEPGEPGHGGAGRGAPSGRPGDAPAPTPGRAGDRPSQPSAEPGHGAAGNTATSGPSAGDTRPRRRAEAPLASDGRAAADPGANAADPATPAEPAATGKRPLAPGEYPAMPGEDPDLPAEDDDLPSPDDEPTEDDDLPSPDDAPQETVPPGAPSAAGASAGPTPPGPQGGAAAARPHDTTVRVRVDLLDRLVQQAGQLVVLRNQIGQLARTTAQDELARLAQQLDVVTGALQDDILRSRMQPVEHLFASLPRLVRELTAACGRQVHLKLGGGDTEADRSLLEAVRDPLTHLVRNAVDHGIEPAAERLAAGKAPFGTLTIQAVHTSGHVAIEVIDDGRGIDPDRVADKAVERGLRTAEQIAAMSTPEILQLLFQPGFSTAEAVSRVSGRGVGMDVVRTKVEAVGGTVDFTSQVGVGTTWHLRIPLTVAIVPVLGVTCAGQVYALPQTTLRELVAVRPGETGIEHVGTAAVYRHRGKLLPVVRLDEALGLPARPEADGALVVLKTAGRRFVLVVDRVLDVMHTMLTPLPTRLADVGAYLGAMLRDNGEVALVVDPRAIARRSGVVVGVAAPESAHVPEADPAPEPEQMLVSAIGDGRRAAVPISSVARIERVPSAALERVGRHEVVQVRGAIVPLVRLDRVLGAGEQPDPEELVVVLYHHAERVVALAVRRIVDIVTDEGRHSAIEDAGLVGSAVLDSHVTELLDGDALVAAVAPAFFGGDGEGMAAALREVVRP
ncbi:chemotaxis protein CheA [Georgenia thermotolerans]|nr:chemotaxis protein CheA [Georgenia thermotolerans]